MNEVLLGVIALGVLAILGLVAVMFAGRDAARGDARELREELGRGLDRGAQSLLGQLTSIATVQNNQIDAFSRQLAELTSANERRLQDLRDTVDAKLRETREDARLGREENATTLRRFGDTLGERFEAIRKDNVEQLERMRTTKR